MNSDNSGVQVTKTQHQQTAALFCIMAAKNPTDLTLLPPSVPRTNGV